MFKHFISTAAEQATDTVVEKINDKDVQTETANNIANNMVPIIVKGVKEAAKEEAKNVVPWVIGAAAFGIFCYSISHIKIVIKVVR